MATTASLPVPPEVSPKKLPGQIKLVIGLMLASAFVVILNETIMSVAMPRLMVDLDITASTAQWLTTGYLLTMAVVIPITGRLLERFSTRAIFISSMSLFSAGTVIAAVAPGFGVLLLGRIVQASGTALMLPLLLTTVLTFVPADRRGRMMGLISIVIAVAPAVGPTISGLVLAALSWRWLFILVIPIAICALILGAVLVRNVTTPRKVHFDVLSMVLSALGFGGLIFGLSILGEGIDHAPVHPLIPVIVGVLALAAFVFRQTRLQKSGDALLNFQPFATRAFSVGVVIMMITMVALLGSLILLPLYLQNVRGLDTLQTGLLMLPGGIATGIAAPIVGRLFDRFGPRPLVIPGSIGLSLSLWGMSFFTSSTPIAAIVAVHVALMVSIGFMLTPLMTSTLGSLPQDLYSHGSAIVNTFQQVAGAAGTALFITMMTIGTSAAVASGAAGPEAEMSGVHSALIWGGVISALSIILACFVRKPDAPVDRTMLVH